KAEIVAEKARQITLKIDNKIIGVIEKMAYFENEETGKKEYVFGSGGGENLADVLKTKVLGRLALKQHYLDEDVFAPSIYQEDHPVGKEYHLIASKIVAEVE